MKVLTVEGIIAECQEIVDEMLLSPEERERRASKPEDTTVLAAENAYLWGKIAEMEQKQLGYLIGLTAPKTTETSCDDDIRVLVAGGEGSRRQTYEPSRGKGKGAESGLTNSAMMAYILDQL